MKRTAFLKIGLTVSLSLLLAGVNWGQKTAPSRSTILTGKTGQSLLKQCSRPDPKNVDGAWTPTLAHSKAADTSLPAFLKTQKSPPRMGAKNLGDYYHQYVGFTRKGRKFLYLNAFSPGVKSSMDDMAKYTKQPRDWKSEPVSVCDGGSSFFGAEYDTKTGKWSLLFFNGPG